MCNSAPVSPQVASTIAKNSTVNQESLQDSTLLHITVGGSTLISVLLILAITAGFVFWRLHKNHYNTVANHLHNLATHVKYSEEEATASETI